MFLLLLLKKTVGDYVELGLFPLALSLVSFFRSFLSTHKKGGGLFTRLFSTPFFSVFHHIEETLPGNSAYVTKTVVGKNTPRKNTLGKNTPRRNTPGKNAPGKNTLGKNTPEKIPSEKISRKKYPGKNTPGL